MAVYKCFECNREVGEQHWKRNKIRCPYCGSKLLYKPRTVTTKVKAV